MTQCGNCGYINSGTMNFCQQCGTEIKREVFLAPRANISDDYDRTWTLTIILAINYLYIILFGLLAILIFFVAVTGEALPYIDFVNSILLLVIGVIPLILAFLMLYLTVELQSYNNTARIIYIILYVINLVASLFILSYVSLVVSLFALYVLTLDKNTVKLFY